MATETLYALNPADGAVRWSRPLDSTVGLRPVTIAGDTIYVTGTFGVIKALSPVDGSQLWQSKGHNGVFSLPVADDSALYVPATGDSFDHGYIDAYRSSDGQLLWEHDLGSQEYPQLALANGLLYASAQDSLMAFHIVDGSLAWQTAQAQGAEPPRPYIIGDALYLEKAGEVWAYSTASGLLRWHFTPPARGGIAGEAVSSAAGLIITTNGQMLRAFHAPDGSLAWTARLDQEDNSGTSAYSDFVYASPCGPLAALDAQAGTLLWKASLSGICGWPPILNNGMLFESRGNYDPGGAGYIYALNPAGGSILWVFTHSNEHYSDVTMI